MHKITIKHTKDRGVTIFIDDKKIYGVINIEIKMSTKNHHYVFLELITDDLDIDIPIAELQIKTPKKRYELLDIDTE